jgi:formate/nitrite transporter FocA (FNT family)
MQIHCNFTVNYRFLMLSRFKQKTPKTLVVVFAVFFVACGYEVLCR